ncbi:type I glyceraldehyde-3-phosphate dehydrogenase [Spiroplasma sp. AdecLV25b]|uniref:type I glyceraldehyde-3-phosphate dehydrogenase n=1 Tax=Spiroplasma sp. AdecLV25b TaxID=3027162 RepID=UPI0027E041CE|nr:type I glyceraldehyde-3-phosphate dehydrogenase [Spiroplasma sp. AdecLV25b]
MATKIAINGFGRIGRLAFRQLFDKKDTEIIAINDLGNVKALAYLLQYDSAHGTWKHGKIKFDETKNTIIVDGKTIKVCQERDPKALPWKENNIDLVIEATGRFATKDLAQAHIDAGAKKCVISAPAKGDLKTIVYNVNHDILKAGDNIISGASCTTNCLAPVVNTLEKEFGLVKGWMTTVHAATNDQRLLDLEHSDFRRGRSALSNIVPASTGAAAAIGLVIPSVNGKLDGSAMRVPIITGSIVDLTVELKKNVTVDEVNKAMKKHSNESFGYNEDQIVSTDIIGSSFGSIFDATLTKVVEVDGKQIVKVFAWYDNEMSYVSQLVRTVLHLAKLK